MRGRKFLPLIVGGAAIVAGCTATSSSDAEPASVTTEAGSQLSATTQPAPTAATEVPEEPAATAETTASTSPPTTLPPGQLLAAYEPTAGCSEGEVVPFGQSPAAFNFEPLGSIWCFDLIEPPAETVVEGDNSWVDDFDVGCPIASPEGCTSMMSLDDGEMRYRTFDMTGNSPPEQGQHWINQNHWMTDVRGGFTGGSSIRPDRSFRFEDGKIVVEGDFAAAIPEYGDDTWGEITVTSAAAPTDDIADILYAYGQFGGHWAVGCRLQSSRIPVCAVMGPTGDSAPAPQECSAQPGNYRVLEVSYFQSCGSVTMGGAPEGELGQYWRQCEPEGPDMACRDRFRMEVTKDSMTLYVNGEKYFEDANWPEERQLPDSFIDSEVYVYQSNWQVRAGTRAFRYHWDRFAVNPPTGPTVSDTYG